MDAILGTLTEAELALVREADPKRLKKLDEDALIELHGRVRRARNKQVKNYRRRAADRVAETGGRGKAYARNARRRAKAEVFEELLSQVSARLATLAHEAAEVLRAEREAEAAAAAKPPRPARVKKLRPQRIDNRPDTPDRRKRHASTRAAGARRQARKDSR
ncbi:hypothetical protein Ade02nite_81870 [Paractinoplanes deccanensis]|uniref:BZIP domain-containing protein n=1 Tax=Paractinoplanes deccanensis TaxID=113561 RepID=A0ABQ3YHS0_9ACTN|nr:hypothetical protein [Actinoplanes deccanensis]GID79546.1 hypothetical protein Ade02nite_81870 [Actinoplanes deccanensis]